MRYLCQTRRAVVVQHMSVLAVFRTRKYMFFRSPAGACNKQDVVKTWRWSCGRCDIVCAPLCLASQRSDDDVGGTPEVMYALYLAWSSPLCLVVAASTSIDMAMANHALEPPRTHCIELQHCRAQFFRAPYHQRCASSH